MSDNVQSTRKLVSITYPDSWDDRSPMQHEHRAFKEQRDSYVSDIEALLDKGYECLGMSSVIRSDPNYTVVLVTVLLREPAPRMVAFHGGSRVGGQVLLGEDGA